MGLDKPFREGDIISAALLEEMRKLLLQVLKVGGGLQMTNTGTGIFITLADSEKGVRLAITDGDGITARAGAVLGKGTANLYTMSKGTGVDPDTNIVLGDEIHVESYLSTEIAANRKIVVGWCRGAGWLVISEDCDQSD